MPTTDRKRKALASMLMASEHESRTIHAIHAYADALLEAHPGEFITPDDARWPEQLDSMGGHVPAGLWIRGQGTIGALEDLVTVDGSRMPTDYGKQVVDLTVKGLREAGKTVVVSALSRVGVRAKEAAWFYPGITLPSIGVLPGGFTEEPGEELLVSLCAPGTPASSTRARAARQLLAALSGTTVIIEANSDDPCLATADLSAIMGRKVGAYPGSIFSSESRGTLQLIKSGAATLVSSPNDILSIRQDAATRKSSLRP